ncbi:MAG: hypothetical protein COW00_13160 [Bdellovibrio sp. CG12_big_fil_rev_8_21_14_0_65_39_13]|nr:MAG: hypothetical protein COW78_11210 [Bdellovibrio sp. CG22_combo_CG10-13_8_21_14_all_39_27]PIQ58878.1 MAG: hypothetical protein COW00_13160 [Bdellovibrio sp. CG12_big_fil_rev_8_21_14_0_65_39_13]PIR35969.1 MAG: hypothetical protein COV37_05535 [Bdellovibrio sp. CG11_big_fil_rev_8_21_14_0_20_39_38]
MKLMATIISLLISFSLFAQSKGIKVFVDLSPAGSFEIVSSNIKGKVKKSGAGLIADKITASVKDFSTGLELRDHHTKEKLEYKTYPKITISNAKGQGGKGQAMIEVRSVKKAISFSYKELSAKYVQVNFNLNLKDFQFSGLSYMGVGVKDTVKVVATLPLGK